MELSESATVSLLMDHSVLVCTQGDEVQQRGSGVVTSRCCNTSIQPLVTAGHQTLIRSSLTLLSAQSFTSSLHLSVMWTMSSGGRCSTRRHFEGMWLFVPRFAAVSLHQMVPGWEPAVLFVTVLVLAPALLWFSAMYLPTTPGNKSRSAHAAIIKIQCAAIGARRHTPTCEHNPSHTDRYAHKMH